MSLAGRIALHGSTVTVKRATKTRTAGGATNLAWAAVAGLTGVQMLFDVPDRGLVERLFGQESKLHIRAMCSADFDVREQDGILVTAGWKAGTNYQVERVLEFDQDAGSRHKEVSLVSTPESLT